MSEPETGLEKVGSAHDFYLKEFEALRREIDAALLDARGLEKAAAIGAGLVWAWLVQQGKDPAIQQARWAWWIPVLFAVLGGLRSWAIGRHLRFMGAYIELVEDLYRRPNDTKTHTARPPGWQHYSKQERFIGNTATVFWWALIAITAVVAILHWPPF